ncbi:TRAP transporter small permease [Halomonas sp. PAMB 3232]|uniref:TRAP transporter small permease n=1 Tax=Halomonas sp. PAMB 3232 TaxID=3075221 RepID=UPI002896A59B|nr:TRAP transporter small permease [Halomonas sp. PAMB 3232]WNL40669.1 TRAP transporter small permease [Halomonas sp. PAMB 3232]
MIKKIDSLLDKTAYASFLLGVTSGIVMTLLIFVSTLMRYLGGRPLRFSDELAGLLFLTLTFLCLPYVLNKGRHIRIEILINLMPAGLARVMDFVAVMVLLTFCAVFAIESWKFMEFSFAINSRTDISSILLWPWMAIMPFSMALCILIQLSHGFKQPASNMASTEDAI